MIEKMVIDYIDKKDLNYIYDKELCDRLIKGILTTPFI